MLVTGKEGMPRMQRRGCTRHGKDHPCTCAMGNIYRFVEPVLLLMLHDKGKSYGYDLSTHLEGYALTDGQIERAVLYRTLRQLEANGYVRSSWNVDPPGPARRMYSLTRDGEGHLREWGQVLGKLGLSMSKFARKAAQ